MQLRNGVSGGGMDRNADEICSRECTRILKWISRQKKGEKVQK